jgi:hypothetical protein
MLFLQLFPVPPLPSWLLPATFLLPFIPSLSANVPLLPALVALVLFFQLPVIALPPSFLYIAFAFFALLSPRLDAFLQSFLPLLPFWRHLLPLSSVFSSLQPVQTLPLLVEPLAIFDIEPIALVRPGRCCRIGTVWFHRRVFHRLL